VLDFAAGCGLAGIAAAQAGAIVEAADIDRFARAAIALNAAANAVAVRVLEEDVVSSACRWDVLIAGDVFYEAPMTRRIWPWLRDCARRAEVIVADPGRAYAPKEGVEEVARYVVPTSRELEEGESRVVRVLRVLP
jgi:predicted nicotinamide N-methyase